MSLARTMLAELDQELTTTRALIALSPEDRLAWKPHEKSWSLGELGLHLANLLTWVEGTLSQTELDLAPVDGPAPPSRAFESLASTLAQFDANVAAARAALEAASDEDLMVTWTLKQAGQSLFSMPRVAVLRSLVMSHMIHHRGQLTVYLRLCDVPLPSVYGPTADAPM